MSSITHNDEIVTKSELAEFYARILPYLNGSTMDVTGSVDINRPNTWTPNTEYDFGDGLYGVRMTGTKTEEASGTINPYVTFISGTNVKLKIVSTGGCWDDGVGGNLVRALPGGNYNVAGTTLISQASVYTGYNSSNQGYVQLLLFSTKARTNAAYDWWVLYMKETVS